jgi:pilus assembly protein Flp/PilA
MHLALSQFSTRLVRRIDGATAMEYALIAAGIAAALIVAMFAVGDDLVTLFDSVGGQLRAKA